MKIKSSLLTLALSIATLSSSTATTLIAYWNFNDLTNGSNNGTSYSPTTGTASLDLIGWTTTATTGITSFGGSTVNAIGTDPAGQALALQVGNASGTGNLQNNGATMVLNFTTINLEDVALSFATRKTGTGFNNITVAWSTDNSTWTDVTSYNPVDSTTLELRTIDFSSISQVDDQDDVYIRFTFAGGTNGSGNNRIDNIQITAIPEPSAALLGCLGLLGLLRRRR